MRIGIDFDNTLACYDSLFVNMVREMGMSEIGEFESKQAIRNCLRQRENGERIWQEIQGKVYGIHMHKAVQFTGENNFLLRCAASPKIEIFIVSHKSEFGHFDNTFTSLREAARIWMQDNGFFDPNKYAIPKTNLFFESSQREKVGRINTLNCDIFIDDLAEIFAHPDFSPTTRKFLFTNGDKRDSIDGIDMVCANWAEIEEAIFDD